MRVYMQIDRATAIRAGKATFGRVPVEVDEAFLLALPPEEREVLATSPLVSTYQTEVLLASVAVVTEATPETLRAALTLLARENAEKREQERLRAAQEEAERERSIQACLAAGVPRRTTLGRFLSEGAVHVTLLRVDQPYPDWMREDPRVQALCKEAERYVDAENDTRLADFERKVAEAEAAEAEAAAERANWIRRNGSARLLRLVDEGIEHTAVYRDERLALERPFWRWYETEPGTYKAARNVPEAALDLLDEARADLLPKDVRGEAQLVFWTDDDGERSYRVVTDYPDDKTEIVYMHKVIVEDAD